MGKIVIIEPESVAREEYHELFSSAGFDVYTAADGKAGLDLIWREFPDLLLLEILLPKIDGFEVLRQVRTCAQTASIPVVLFTKLGHEEDIAHARHLGAHEYCIKAHHTPQEIVQKVMALLSR